MNSLPSNNSNLSFSIDQSPYMEATITQFPEVTIEGEGGRNASLNTRFSLCALSTLLDGRLVTGASDGSIKIWRNACCEMTLSKHSSYIRTLAVLKNGLLASGSADKTIDLWDLTYLPDCKAIELFKMGWGDIPYDTSYLSEIGDGSSTNDDSNNLVFNTISDANLHTHFNAEPPKSLQDIYQIKGSLSELTLEIEKLKKNKLSPNADQRLSQIEQKISQLEENNGSIVGRGAQVQLTRRLGFNHQESQKINQEIGSTIHQLRDITDVVCRLKEDLDGLRQEWERGENLKKDPTRSERNIRVVVVSLVIVALGVFVAYQSVLSKKKK